VTLRDGAQQEGLTLSVVDKLAIARQLDALGVGFIEGGWPGANPKDTEFFRRAASELELTTAQLAAFGSTRRAHTAVEQDPQVAALLNAGTPVITLVAKSHDRHVELALRTTQQENLAMIADTVMYLSSQGRRVFLDAEHFFDGYRANPDYALAVVEAAASAGAEAVVLCDTNGGMLPGQITEILTEVRKHSQARLGIHCHDDAGCGVANTLAGVAAGATHVQGTANGYGERCGNANLLTVIANLELKLGHSVLPPGRLANLRRTSQVISEITNLAPNSHQPYVGASAFAHKAGLHASAVKIDPMLYQHVDPQLVGNGTRTVISELAGRASIELRGRELGYDLSNDRSTATRVVDRVKELEAKGYTFEAADASLELLLRAEIAGSREEYFEVESWRVIIEQKAGQPTLSEATVKLRASGRRIVVTGEGNGPVNALDRALRLALEQLYPELASLHLVDYKVRILEGVQGTAAVTRVLVQSSDGEREWGTVGVDENIIAASWQALIEAVTYGLTRDGRSHKNASQPVLLP
ncbi:MAG: citramalate synthase, partial [Candidatus Dormibacteraceae bacterium]